MNEPVLQTENPKPKRDKKFWLGWIGVSLTLIFASLWAYWGAIGNFLEAKFLQIFYKTIFHTCLIITMTISLCYRSRLIVDYHNII